MYVTSPATVPKLHLNPNKDNQERKLTSERANIELRIFGHKRRDDERKWGDIEQRVAEALKSSSDYNEIDLLRKELKRTEEDIAVKIKKCANEAFWEVEILR